MYVRILLLQGIWCIFQQMFPTGAKDYLLKHIHYDPLMMSKKGAPRKHPWLLPREDSLFGVNFQPLIDSYGCFLSASFCNF